MSVVLWMLASYFTSGPSTECLFTPIFAGYLQTVSKPPGPIGSVIISVQVLILVIACVSLFVAMGILLGFPCLLILELSDNGGFPLGTLVAWFGLIAETLTALMIFQLMTYAETSRFWLLERALVVSLIVAMAWEFVCYGLAGNWYFNFSGSSQGCRGSSEAGTWFWTLTAVLVIVPLVILFAVVVQKIGRK